MSLGVRPLCLACAVVLAPCVREPRSPSSDHTHTTSDARSASHELDASADVVITSEPAVAPPGLGGVIEAVRRENWQEAHDRFVRLPDLEQRTREGRYVGGRIAFERGEYQDAARAFHGLAAEFPALGNEIQRLDGQSLARAGDHAGSRAVFQALASHSHAARDRAYAAEETLLAGDAAAASLEMRDWIDDPPAGLDRARAWRDAAHALSSVGDRDRAVRAWKRILVDEPDSAAADEASSELTRSSASLSTDERLSRASHLNERARYDQVIGELSAMPPGTGGNESRRLHLLGRALYHSRAHYADANLTLRAAGQRADDPDRDEDLFLAARSLSRSDRDDEAIVAYDQLAQQLHGRWSHEAAYRALWLVAHERRVDSAVQRVREFLRDRGDADPRLRSDVAWEAAWALYEANRLAESIPFFEQSGALATHAMERGRGRYWAAVARLRSGDSDGAVRGFQAIIADRPLTWYALLAETRLRERSVSVPPPLDPAPRRPAPTLELPDNVRWLRALGFDREGGAVLAAEEDALRARLPHDRADEVIALAYMELGEEFRAYTIAQRHNDLLDHEPTPETRWAWDCAYPRPHAALVESAEDANHLPRHYLFAIMRQESAFNPHDVSNARAIGLLQMIPPTTRHVAQELHIEFREEQLFDPAYNIRTGGYYIGRLFAQYHGVLPRAIGAFNAGPNAMGRWVQRAPDVDTDVFVERIPYDETRTYVRRVMQNLARYRYLYGPRDAEWPLRVGLRGESTVDHIVDY